MTEQTLSQAENEAASALVRESLARRRVTRQFLADEARISLSTLEKALSGQRAFTLASIVRLEAALGISLRKPPRPADHDRVAGVAPVELGSYARQAVSWIEGQYLTLRTSFSRADTVYAYLTTISWNEEASHLDFVESERIDAAFTQSGRVSIPHQSGHVYLVTNELGQHRLIVVSRPTIEGDMVGLLTTLQVGKGTSLLPVATPIVLVPLRRLPGNISFGHIEAGHARYESYRAELSRAIDDGFAKLIER
ncbi:helix-turn-helix domain-containing protein [Mesorhizobium sp. ASY16-5R]|uniref:helix-turn-helix domain-containing protein n=1 Tax=Mesorhizobium sp. ASY16-5R TaxID=3445772 RepID=UPI003FA105A9